MKLLLKILWGKQSKWQFVFAAIGFWIGLIIMLLSIQLYTDVNQLLGKEKSNDDKTYLIVNKQITLVNTFNKASSGFDDTDITNLKSQPGVIGLAQFQRNTFKIEASLQAQMGFSAPVPFEAVPDEFIDSVPEVFKWNEKENFIPVILSSELLRFYNLGVALSTPDMPQLPPSIIQMYPFDIKISGNGQSRNLKARVVGYSDRIPAVLVPKDFMDWANNTYGDTVQAKRPARVMLEVESPALEHLGPYLKEKGYQTNQEQLRFNNAGKILKVVVSLTGLVGVLFVGLSFIIFLISFQLIISRAKQEISLLLDIGYTYTTVARILNMQFFIAMLLIVGTVFPVLIYVVRKIHLFLLQQHYPVNTGLANQAIGAGIAALLVVTIFNMITLRGNLKN